MKKNLWKWVALVLKCWWFTVCRSPMCLHFVSGDCGGNVSVEVWEGTKCEEGYGAGYVCKIKTKTEKRQTRETPLQFHLKVSPHLALHQYFKWLFSAIPHLLELDKSFRLVCQGRYYHCQALREKAIEMQRGRVKTWKGYPVETGVPGATGEPGTSPWECTYFHVSPSLRRESITSTMGLQMAVPATQGCLH